jgi:hypothetical protein
LAGPMNQARRLPLTYKICLSYSPSESNALSIITAGWKNGLFLH